MARKRGLGRGLDALIVKEDVAPLQALPIDRIQPNRLQPRTTFVESDLTDLEASIRAQGIVQPIVVTPESDGTHSIIAGERRWRAARMAGLTEVPVVVREVADDQERLELALVENLQRSDLNPVEEAEAYVLLRERFSLSQEEIGKRVGKGRTTITNALRLLKLPDEIRELLRRGELKAGQARPLLALEDSGEQLRLARAAARDGLSAREMEALASKGRPEATPKKAKKARPVEVHAAAAAEKLTRKLQTKVEIRRRGKGGQMLIHFHSEEELMRLYDHLVKPG
jgi:ParB family chromosome partitioning protein